MKVYLVWYKFYSDCEWELEAIFDSEEKAKEYIKQKAAFVGDEDNFVIDDQEVK